MTSLRTPYQVLNLCPDAEPVVIDAAYRALIKKYHPDLWLDDPNAQARAASINQAFATLRDPAAKAECDRKIRAWRNAVHTPPLQPIHPPARRPGLWWGGWAAAGLVGLAQFLPWQSLDPQARQVPQDTQGLEQSAANPGGEPGARQAALPGAELPPAVRAELELPPLTPPPYIGPDAAASQPDIRNYVPASQGRSPARERGAAKARPPTARNKAAPARQPAAEKEFLEREGYIY
jgi:curved DNA-binding protein CbpA